MIASLTTAPVASAQTPAAELRSYRHMAVGNITFLNDIQPSLQGGYLAQMSLFKNKIEIDDLGVETITPPRWYGHSLLSGGWSFDGGNEGRFSGRGQLGLLYTFDGPITINRIGPIAQATWGPEGYGPGLRTEFFHGNAALSVGWMSFAGNTSNGVFVSIDLMRCILQDLGIVESCKIR